MSGAAMTVIGGLGCLVGLGGVNLTLAFGGALLLIAGIVGIGSRPRVEVANPPAAEGGPGR